jgi:hypothetical protein
MAIICHRGRFGQHLGDRGSRRRAHRQRRPAAVPGARGQRQRQRQRSARSVAGGLASPAGRGPAPRRGAARRHRPPRLPLPCAGQPRDRRRGVRRAPARAARSRGAVPRAGDRRQPDPARGRQAEPPVRARAPPCTDAVPGQRLLARRAGRLGRARRARRRRSRALRVRAQDRRHRGLADLRQRGLHRGRDPRRRRHRRGHHAEPTYGAHAARAAGDGSGAGTSGPRGARRDLPAGRGLPAHQPRAGRRRPAPVRQPTQRRGRYLAPEGPRRHRVAAAAPVVLRRGRGRGHGHAPRAPFRGAGLSARRRPAGQRRDHAGADAGGGVRGLRELAAPAPRAALPDRRRRGEGRRAGAARSRSSSPPRSAPRASSASRSTPAAPER